jgi:hypothetical protein
MATVSGLTVGGSGLEQPRANARARAAKNERRTVLTRYHERHIVVRVADADARHIGGWFSTGG